MFDYNEHKNLEESALLQSSSCLTNYFIMATNTADVEVGEKSPLISHGRDKQPLEEISGTTKTEKAVAGFSLVSFVSSFAGMLMERNLIVYISGIIGIIGMSAFTKKKISFIGIDSLASHVDTLPFQFLRMLPFNNIRSHMSRLLRKRMNEVCLLVGDKIYHFC